MDLAQIEKNVLEELLPRNVSYVGIFGSYARNEQTAESDLDILVEFKEHQSLFELIGIEHALEDKLKMKIDLVTKGSLNKHFAPYILSDVKCIYNG